MATIYNKIVDNYLGYDKCIVLENREAFLYPIPNQIMSNWSELRIGFICSLTSTSGDALNTPFHTYKNIGFSSTSKEESYYFGLKSNNNSLPYNSDCSYIGLAPLLNKQSSIDFYNNSAVLQFYSNNIPQITCLLSSGINYQTGSLITFGGESSDGYGIIMGTNFSCGSGSPFMRFATKIIKTGNNNLTLTFCRENLQNTAISPSPTNDSSISGLRDFMLSFGNNDNSQKLYTKNTANPDSYSRFNYTSDFTPSGQPIEIPNSLFFYWPFTGSKLRIHNFCVEKYA